MSIKCAWPEVVKKDMTPAKRHKMRLENILLEKKRKEFAATRAEMLAEARRDIAKEQGAKMGEIRARLLALNPKATVRMSVNAKGTIQARVNGKFVKI